MCFIFKQNAGRGMIQDRADIIPQQINIALWIGIRKSLNRNVLIGKQEKSFDQDSFFSPYISFKLFPELRKRDDTTGFYLPFI
jgi:hypothetical protein